MSRLALLSCLVLAACASAETRCVRDATRDLRTVNDLIVETEQTLSRGYAYRTEIRDVRVGVGFCSRLHRSVGFCFENDPVTVQRPVAVDLDAEQAKLDSLLVRRDALTQAAEPRIEACKALG